MKKIIAMLLALTMVLALAACGGDDPKETGTGGDPAVQTNPVEDQPETTPQTEPQAQHPSGAEMTVEYLKAQPVTPIEELEYDLNWDEDGIVIDGYIGTNEVVVIPSEIDGLPVVELSKYAFGQDSTVRGVLIPDSVKDIKEAFVNNSTTELVIAEGLENISYGAFTNCSALKQVKLGDNVVSMDVTAFFGCSALEKVNIPATLEGMELVDVKSAFMTCDNVTIYGEAGSFIEGACQELGIPFVAE